MPFTSSSSTPSHHYSFPLFLFPSNPFRRRSSTTSTSTNLSSPSTSPPTHPTSYLSTQPTSHLRCHKCLADLIPTSSIVSKGFTGRHGRAYLIAPPTTSVMDPAYQTRFGRGSDMPAGDLLNIVTHKPVPRQLVTGAHTVSDIGCRTCGTILGWKYVEAEEESQKYKVGKFILETKKVVRGVGCEGYEEDGDGDQVNELGGQRGAKGVSEEIEFDSQDEDECEDLFSGIWSPALARRRRKNRVLRRDD
ncbi:yippee-domain-containing protein [Lophiostoma macrostomum CBS 122681]|uniref:Yippee-domain-containing protein n=1 Tax=Lophiostoma macrostomum CBS 122681 TaxID=1314788 RepID=A0A6A6SRU1_9PLEO|nr:yippee-domain-containing protein [Lophiostoma macrostomum CBS 122681]